MSHPFRLGRLRTLAIGFLGLLSGAAILASSAGAEEATVSATTYLRAGPGIAFRSLDEATGGARVEILDCTDGWCRIRLGDAAGYVAAAALVRGPDASTAIAGPTSCFLNRQSGFHGSREVRFCSPASAR